MTHLTRYASGEGQGFGLPPERAFVSAAVLRTSLSRPFQWKSGDTFERYSSVSLAHGVAGGGFSLGDGTFMVKLRSFSAC